MNTLRILLAIAISISCYACHPFHPSTRELLSSETTCSSNTDCPTGLVCSNSTCTSCTIDAECKQTSSEYICYSGNPDFCKHKHLWKLSGLDGAAFVCLLVGGAIAAGGGIGGGGLFVPILILLAHFDAKSAAALSNALICGASIANFIQMAPRHHPTANRPLIDYNLALVLQPMSLGGTVLGVFFNSMFPEWLILSLLILLLAVTIYRTIKKGIDLWRAERITAISAPVNELFDINQIEPKDKDDQQYSGVLIQSWAIDDREDEDEQELHLPPEAPLKHRITPSNSSSVPTSSPMPQIRSDLSTKSPELQAILNQEAKVQWKSISILFSVLIVTTLVSLLRGSNSGSSIIHIKPCSAYFWLLVAGLFIFLICMAIYIGISLVRLNTQKETLRYPFQKGDIRWNVKSVTVMTIVSFFAGILASLLGIGGGMVLSPIMLELRVLPDVTSSTSSFMILFTSIASVVQYSILGTLVYDYGIVFAVIGLVASVIGQTAINYLVKKYGKKSYIIFSICIILIVSAVLLTYSGLRSLVNDIKSNQNLGFEPLCK